VPISRSRGAIQLSWKEIAMTVDSSAPVGRSAASAGNRLRAQQSLDLWAWLYGCAERRRQRIALAALNDRMLADLGLSRQDVSRESAKWPWQP
jgi:uncharacterized protein YjiS (DUF1127 family)